MGAKAFSRIEKWGMNMVSKGRAGVFRSAKLSLREHATFLHDPWREFYEYRCMLAFIGEGSMRDGREWGGVGKIGRGDALPFIGSGRGGRSGFGS